MGLVSLHQQDNFPPQTIPSHIDTPLSDNIGDDQYLQQLSLTLAEIEKRTLNCGFDLCIYVAGADPYTKDPLGGINISLDGMRKRDRMVAEFCKKHNIPVAVVLAGGYADA